jgi:multidrug efflux system outer membrane protein
MMLRTKIIILLFSVGLAACKIPRITENKEVALPTHFSADTSMAGQSMAANAWEQFFPDTLLQKYIRLALSQNPDYLVALQQVSMAKAHLYGQKFWFLPSIQGLVGAGMRRFGKYTIDGVGNFDTNFSPNIEPEQRMNEHLPDLMLGLDLSWEIDIRGKLRNQKKAARLRKEAALGLAQFAQAQLITTVAEYYYTLAALDAELEIIKKNVALQQRAFETIEIQKSGGRANELGVTQIEAQLLHTQGLEFLLKQEVIEVKNGLRLLLGQPTLDIPAIQFPDKAFSHITLTSGKVSDFLQNRPDIRQAELEYLASGADVKAARAAFFPSLTISAQGGFNSFNPSFFLTAPTSLAYQAMAGLVSPIFQQGAIRSQYRMATARQEIAYQQYRKTVMQAYLEVMNLMQKMNTLQEAISLKSREVTVLSESVQISNTLFITANASYLEILNAQQNVLNAELTLVELRRDLYFSTLRYYRALGGATQPGAMN